MIFDSVVMQELRDRNKQSPDHRVPAIVFLDRSDDLSEERQYLEQLIASVRQTKQREWLGRLLDPDEGQYWGTWFEMYLYGWLQEIGRLDVEPEIAGCTPDFVLHHDGTQIVVEAHATLISATEREHRDRRAEIGWQLRQIPFPYMVLLQERTFAQALDLVDLRDTVSQWLSDDPSHSIRYKDGQGNLLLLEALAHPTGNHVEAVWSHSAWIGPESLRPALQKKARQHKALRTTGYPYVLAIFLQSSLYSAEEIAEAWFGRIQTTVDWDSQQVIDEGLDGTGLHFCRSEVRHRTVSGTLVFKATHDGSLKRHTLRSWYIQNPYARTPLESDLFPVEGRFVVTQRGTRDLSMDWQPGTY